MIIKRIIRKLYNITRPESIAWRLRNIHIKRLRRRLKNKDFSLIASNCNGGVMCSDLGVPFNSPFVNLFISAGDFVRLCSNLKFYLDQELRFVNEIDPVFGKVDYPTAYLGDVKIHFMHYKDEDEAKTTWKRRLKRINMDNLFVIFTDRDGCNGETLEEFDKLPIVNKVVFTHLPHPELKSAFYIRGFEKDNEVGILSDFQNSRFCVKRILDQFDYVKWLNR